MTTTTEPTTILTLEGPGYSLAVSAEIEAAKSELLEASGKIGCVNDNDESNAAQFQIRRLASFRNLVEKSRVEVKKPIIDLGRAIDAAAKEFAGMVVNEERRLALMVGKHTEEMAAAKRAAEAEERRKFEEARKAKEEAERAAAEAERARLAAVNAVSIQDAIAAKQAAREADAASAKAEEERQAAQRERMASSAAVATTHVSSGVRFALDFEVIDIERLYSVSPDLVELTPKRAAIMAKLKLAEEAHGFDAVETNMRHAGLRVTRKPVVSTR